MPRGRINFIFALITRQHGAGVVNAWGSLPCQTGIYTEERREDEMKKGMHQFGGKAIIIMTVIACMAGTSWGGPFIRATPLTNGVAVTSSIGAGGEQWFKFRTSNFSVISIDALAGTLTDPYVQLYLVDETPMSTGIMYKVRSLIQSDDDSGVGVNAKIERPLSYPSLYYTWYYIRVTGHSSNLLGTFSVRYSNRDATVVNVTPNGVRVTGTISSATEYDWYRLQVPGPGACIMETAAGTLADTYMELFQYIGYDTVNLIAGDDDSGDGYASRISANLIKTTSSNPYFVKVRAKTESQTGTYQFWVRPAGAPVIWSATLSACCADGYSPNGAPTGRCPVVRLMPAVSNAPAECMMSESPIFAGASWIPFQDTMYYQGSTENGNKTLYFKMRNAVGESSVVSRPYTVNDRRFVLTVGGAPHWDTVTVYPRDSYRFYVSSAGVYRFQMDTGSTAFYLYLYGPNTPHSYMYGAKLSGFPGTPYFDRTLNPGMYYLDCALYGGGSVSTGTYSIAIIQR
jgi:hypothetical protein